MDAKKIENWIRRQLYYDRDGGGATRILLKHVSDTGRGQTVSTIEVEHDNIEDFITQTVNSLCGDALADSSGLGGMQKYVVQAFNKQKQLGRTTFRLQGSSEDEEETFSSEPANPTGLLGQMMRHNEASSKLLIASFSTVTSSLQNQLRQTNEVLEGLDW